MIEVTTREFLAGFGCDIVTDVGVVVGKLFVQGDEVGNRTLVLYIQGAESHPDTAQDVREQLAGRGFHLADMSYVESLVSYAHSYGVRVSRDPDEAARFRMEFVSGPRRGEIVEVDVRTDGTKVS